MEDGTKIQLSALEAELVNNSEWILTKNRIIEKVKYLLQEVQVVQQSVLNDFKNKLPAEVLAIPGKISRGENYKGLPYLILDHPRYFDKENVFAIRTLFWWGNFFSITLHVAGKYRTGIIQGLIKNDHKRSKDLHYCINETEWDHHFEAGNYRLLSEMDEAELLQHASQSHFIKLSQKIPLTKWDDAVVILPKLFREMIEIVAGKINEDD